MQMAKKTFLRSSYQQMRRGFIGVMLKARCSRGSGGGMSLLDQKKKSRDDSIKDQGDVVCAFSLERQWPS